MTSFEKNKNSFVCPLFLMTNLAQIARSQIPTGKKGRLRSIAFFFDDLMYSSEADKPDYVHMLTCTYVCLYIHMVIDMSVI